MRIPSHFDHRGTTYQVVYTDGVPEPDDPIQADAVHSYCFYGDKLVIVRNTSGNLWTPPGGSIESGETYEEAAVREIQEESNMNVLHMECMGYQDVDVPAKNKTVRQYRMFCIVEPYGEFESDPDGDVLEVKLIAPADYKEYILWGELGDHLMSRALALKSAFETGVQA